MINLVLANVRTPAEREGDLLAQCMAIRRGEQRLRELVGRYGLPTLARNMAALQNYSEHMIRAAIAALPDGEYGFEDYLDGDGVQGSPDTNCSSHPNPRRFSYRRFHRFGPPGSRPRECKLRVALSAAMYVFRCLVRTISPTRRGCSGPSP